MRILHVVASVNRETGGPAFSVTRLAAEQAKLGHEVTVAALDYERHGPAVDPAPAKLDLTKADFLAVHGRGWSAAFARRVRELTRNVDVVHNHALWMWPNKYARCAANEAGKPLVISTRGMVEGWSLRRAVFRKFVAWHLFERKNLESAALFHATSESEAKSIEDAFQFKFKLKFKKPTVVVAPNGVDVPETIPGREILEARFAKLRGKEWVLFMSRIHPKKGLDVLLEAWKQQMAAAPSGLGLSEVTGGGSRVTGNDPSSISQTPSATRTPVLVIAGADLIGYGAEVERMIREKGLGETVLMTGHVDGEMREALLGNAKFFVLPSYSENFGLVVAESLAAGRPALTTTRTPWGATKQPGDGRSPQPLHAGGWATAAPSEMGDGGDMNLERNGCGVICEVSGLKEALGRMLRFSDEELDEMGARGRREVERKFSWKAAAEAMVDAYKLLIRNSDCGIRK